jgi:5-formyltetrahydrofolate cyclo-ligase
VHELQVLPSGEIPTAAHDFHLDLVATPERVVRCPRRGGRARAALRWDELKPEKIASIPLLARLAREGQPS